VVNSKDDVEFALLFTLWASLSATTQQVGKTGGLQILRCQGIAVVKYSFTLDAWTLKPFDFCNVGVNIESPSAERETPGSLLVADDENINFRALYLSCFRDE